MLGFIAALTSRLRCCSAAVQTFARDAARTLVIRKFSSFSSDLLYVQDARGRQIAVFGDPKAHHLQTPAVLTVHDDFFWVRVLLFGDIGFAQSYMLREVSTPDLTAVFVFFIHNGTQQQRRVPARRAGVVLVAGQLTSLVTRVMFWWSATNSISTAKLNASAHYSLSNDMFAAFLSKDMTYSAALWLPTTDPAAQKETLEQAQRRKLEYAVSAAKIKASDHVLEVGTGWGSFAMTAAQSTGCRVTTVTVSMAQKQLAERRVAEAGLSDRVRVLFGDYREIPSLMRAAMRTTETKTETGTDTKTTGGGCYDGDDEDVKFDKIVSIEMIEHVGPEFLETYFACMDAYLKKDGGVGYFQCITIPEARYGEYAARARRGGGDFVQRYIFPGGHLPTVSGLVAGIERGSRGRLVVQEMVALGGHYVKTLRCWRERFAERFEGEVAPALRREYPGMGEGEMSIFRRKWNYYFCYSEAGFRTLTLGDVGITVAREGAVEVLEGMPV